MSQPCWHGRESGLRATSYECGSGGTDTESVSNRFLLAKTTVTRGKFHSTWESMTNFLEKFSEEHRMPTLRSRISVSCFDILDSMSGREGAIISFGSLVSLN